MEPGLFARGLADLAVKSALGPGVPAASEALGGQQDLTKSLAGPTGAASSPSVAGGPAGVLGSVGQHGTTGPYGPAPQPLALEGVQGQSSQPDIQALLSGIQGYAKKMLPYLKPQQPGRGAWPDGPGPVSPEQANAPEIGTAVKGVEGPIDFSSLDMGGPTAASPQAAAVSAQAVQRRAARQQRLRQRFGPNY